MNFVKKNIKLILGIIIGTILISGISVYATSQYFASQVVYKDGISVENALNYLYKINNENRYVILETGTVNSNSLAPSGYQSYTITFENTYVDNQNAFCVIIPPVSVSGTINPYINSEQFSKKIIGNTLSFNILNYTGATTNGSVSFNYAVLGTPSN